MTAPALALGVRRRARSSPAGAVGSYLLLLRWLFLRQRRLLAVFVMIQIVIGVGVIYGFGFLIPDITPQAAVYLSTGATTLTLILVGLVIVPQEIAQARVSGRKAYLDALPVPRLAPILAEVTFWMLVQLPGAVATLALAVARFGLHLHLSPLAVPAVALTALTAASVGCAISMALPPAATQQVTQFLSLSLLLFSPLNFPITRLPVWLQDVHRGLPVVYIADLIRGSLTGQYGVNRLLAFAVVGAWCAFGLTISVRAATRRG